MSVANLEEWVLATVAELCQQDRQNVTADTNVLDLGLDSLGLSVLMAQVETNCHCEFNEIHVAQLFEARSLRDLIAVVRSAVPARESPEA
jgi:acyl carrier protein